MAFLEDLYEGSIDGAVFYVTSATTSFGRKQVKHEYPNSDRQRIQDLGLKPRSFSITAVIGRETEIDPRTYQQKKNDILRVMESGREVTLSHPFFSASFQVIPRPGTVTERLNQLGIAEFDLEFDISNRQTDPIPAQTSLSQINQALNNVNLQVNADIANNFGVSTNFNLEAAQNLLNTFSEFTASTTNTFNKLQQPNNEFSSILSGFTENINDLIQSPQDLADSFQGVINSTAGLYQTTREALQVAVRFFEFGDDIIRFPSTTDERAERNLNNQVISQGTQVSYLGLSYQFASETTFTTVDEINELQETLENEYQKLVEDKAQNEVLLALNDLRVLTNQFLENEKLNAAQIIDINTRENSISLIAFQYYGDTERLQEITNTLVDLNRPETNNPTFVEGDLQILTQ